MIGRYEKSVQRMIRLKDAIGRDGRCRLEDHPKVCPMDSDWTRRRCHLEDFPRVRPKDSDWTRRRCCVEDLPKVRLKDSEWTRKSNLSV